MTTELRRLHAAVPRRRTNRSPFAGVTPGPAEVNALHRAAQAEGAWLHVIADETQRQALWEKALRARHEQSADADFRAELDRWTTTGSDRGDGVPEAVGGIRPPQAALQIGRGVAPIATPRRSAADLVGPREHSAPHPSPS